MSHKGDKPAGKARISKKLRALRNLFAGKWRNRRGGQDNVELIGDGEDNGQFPEGGGGDFEGDFEIGGGGGNFDAVQDNQPADIIENADTGPVGQINYGFIDDEGQYEIEGGWGWSF